MTGLLSQLLEVFVVYMSNPFESINEGVKMGYGIKEIQRGIKLYPYNVFSIVLLLSGMAYLYFNIFSDNKLESRFKISDKNSYGTSGFMDRKRVKEVYDIVKSPSGLKKNDGTILGQTRDGIIIFPSKSYLNKNIAVFGASGSMKSRSYVRNKMFQCVVRGESLVITDPKSELFNDFRVYLEDKGYIVKAFNLTSPKHSDSWNCLSETEGDEILSQVFCEVIMQNTSKGNDDGFWVDSMQNLLKALVLYIYEFNSVEKRNIGEVYNMLVNNDLKALSILFDRLDGDNSAKQCYNIFDRATDGVKASVITGLAGRLQVFQAELIKKITSVNDIDLTKLGQEKCAYFLITSDQDTTFDFLGSLFISFVFIKNVKYADKYGEDGVLPVPIHILADEIANIGEIPDLKKKISTVRSRGISLSVIFQSIAQMENRYRFNQWAEIIGNCDTQLFLGCTDEVTAKYISNRSGEVTAEREEKTNRNFPRKKKSYNQRKLLNSDEVLRLDGLEALVITRGEKILPVKKFDYTKHPESKKLIKTYAKDYVPNYTKNKKELAEVEKDKVSKAKVVTAIPKNKASKTDNNKERVKSNVLEEKVSKDVKESVSSKKECMKGADGNVENIAEETYTNVDITDLLLD